jgi:serine/threonine protein kinase
MPHRRGQSHLDPKHPNVVEVLDLGNVGTDFFLTMNWVNGKTLYSLLNAVQARNKIISKSFLFYVFQKTAQGLHYAHEMKDSANRPMDMVHCDISPQNILIGYEGEVKLSDFGIATAEKSKEQASNEALLGKLPYMAPEQISLKGFDRRVDIYSFGVLLYESLTGKKPFEAPNVHDLQFKIMKEIPKYTSKVFQGSPEIKAFVESCLEKDPNNRPSSISEFFKLENEVGDVDEAKISKLMKLMFQDDIRREKANIQQAIDELIELQKDDDLLSGDDEVSMYQELSAMRVTDTSPADASQEMTRVLMDEPDKNNMGKVQVQKVEVVRVIKKKPIEEEWLDAETTQRRHSRELVEPTRKTQTPPASDQLNDIFDEDRNESTESVNFEKTTVDYDENLEKKWNQVQKTLREKSDEPQSLDEFTEDTGEKFEPSYPNTDKVVTFTKQQVSQPVQSIKSVASESETRESQLSPNQMWRAPQKKQEPAHIQTQGKPLQIKVEKPVKTEEEFFQEISKSKEGHVLQTTTFPTKSDAITFRIRKRTLLLIVLFVGMIGSLFFSKNIGLPQLPSFEKAVPLRDVHVVNLYVSVEEFRNTQEKSSVSLWMNPEFQQGFLSPIQAFFEREYKAVTGKEQLPFRFVVSGFERSTPKIPWQGSLINAYLPFEKFDQIFQIHHTEENADHANIFIHLYSKEINLPTEYPLDYQGKRPPHNGVLYYPMFSETDNEFQLRLIHEIIHALGGKDLYNDTGLPRYPEGYVEPFREPLHPQVQGEIMSRTIPQSPAEYIPLSNLEDARIGAYTAFTMGWITEEEKDTFYKK